MTAKFASIKVIEVKTKIEYADSEDILWIESDVPVTSDIYSKITYYWYEKEGRKIVNDGTETKILIISKGSTTSSNMIYIANGSFSINSWSYEIKGSNHTNWENKIIDGYHYVLSKYGW